MLRILAGALIVFCFMVSGADAASRVWITEFQTMASTDAGGVPAPIASLPATAIQSTLDISATVQTSAAFNAKTRFIRVLCEVQCSLRGDGVTATTASTQLPALLPEYFGVQPGATISVIASP